MQRRMAQIEESVARYLHQLDSADLHEPSLGRTTKATRLKKKIAKLKVEMQRLQRPPSLPWLNVNTMGPLRVKCQSESGTAHQSHQDMLRSTSPLFNRASGLNPDECALGRV
jgi:hypothetical protein